MYFPRFHKSVFLVRRHEFSEFIHTRSNIEILTNVLFPYIRMRWAYNYKMRLIFDITSIAKGTNTQIALNATIAFLFLFFVDEKITLSVKIKYKI